MILSPEQWKTYIQQQAIAPHLLQTEPWAKLKERFGWTSFRVGIEMEGEIVAGVQVLLRPLPFPLGKIAYIPKGPAIDWENSTHAEPLLREAGRVARARGAIALLIEPEVESPPESLHALGFTPSPAPIQPRQTILIDLQPSPEEIIARFKQKTRYNIRLAEKKEVTTRLGNESDIPTFYQLLQTTGTRDAFGIHPAAYYQTAYQLFAPSGQVALWIAEYEGNPLAGVLVFTLGKRAWYLYGASGEQERQRMPAYAAQWAAILWAREQGCTSYDLYGIPDAPPEQLEAEFTERTDGLWQVFRYKRGWAGDIVRTMGCWQQVYAPLRYRIHETILKWSKRRQQQ